MRQHHCHCTNAASSSFTSPERTDRKREETKGLSPCTYRPGLAKMKRKVELAPNSVLEAYWSLFARFCVCLDLCLGLVKWRRSTTLPGWSMSGLWVALILPLSVALEPGVWVGDSPPGFRCCLVVSLLVVFLVVPVVASECIHQIANSTTFFVYEILQQEVRWEKK